MANNQKSNFIRNSYDKSSLFLLFALCALPLHIWAIYKAFPGAESIYYALGVWDATSYIFYVLLYCLVESIIVFLGVLLLSLLGSIRWKKTKLAVIVGSLFLLVALSSIVGQLYLDYQSVLIKMYEDFIFNYFPGYSLRVSLIIFFIELVIVFVSVIGVIFILDRNERVFRLVRNLIEKISVLSTIYIFFDVVGLFVFLIRNLFHI